MCWGGRARTRGPWASLSPHTWHWAWGLFHKGKSCEPGGFNPGSYNQALSKPTLPLRGDKERSGRHVISEREGAAGETNRLAFCSQIGLGAQLSPKK